MDQDETWHGGRPRPISHCVRWGPSSTPQKGGTAAFQFSAHVYSGQTAGWMKMPLGTHVGLDLGDIVLDGDPAPHRKRGQRHPALFGPCVLWSSISSIVLSICKLSFEHSSVRCFSSMVR